MCLSIPGEVLSVQGDEALVSIDGVNMHISLLLLNGIRPGDFVLIHSGFAIQTIDQDEAEETLKIIRLMQTR